MIATLLASPNDVFPNLSTALQKYVPVTAGTEIDCAGHATVGTISLEFA